MRKFYAVAAGTHTDWKVIDLALESIPQILLLGPPSSGKTYAAQRTGLNGRPMTTITLTVETPAAELRGFYMPNGTKFEWFDGVAVQALKSGGRLVINEISSASSDVMSFLFPILEDPETCCLTLPNGETVRSAPGFQVVATDNGEFEHLPEPIQSRLVPFFVKTPRPEAYEPFPEKWRALIKRTVEAEDPEERLSLRHWLKVLALVQDRGMTLPAALRVLVKNAADNLIDTANCMEVV